MHEHLRKRDQVREITREVLQTFGSLQPKLEHLAATPLPDKSSLIQIVGDLLEVIYPGYFGRKYVEVANIEYHIGDLIDSIYARVTQEMYRSVRPRCDAKGEDCDHCWKVAEGQAILFLRKLAKLRVRLSADVQAAYDGDPGCWLDDKSEPRKQRHRHRRPPRSLARYFQREAHRLHLPDAPSSSRLHRDGECARANPRQTS